jgi:hypothetical protein
VSAWWAGILGFIIGVALMLAGLEIAVRIIRWREKRKMLRILAQIHQAIAEIENTRKKEAA